VRYFFLYSELYQQKYILESVILKYRSQSGQVKQGPVEQGKVKQEIQSASVQSNEARFRALLEATHDWVWEMDADGMYTCSSPEVYDLLGYHPEEIIGKTPFDLMANDEAGRMSAEYSRCMLAQQAFTATENTSLHRQGHEVMLETSGVPVFNDQGMFCGYLGISRDITDRKLADVALKSKDNHYRLLLESVQAIPWEVDMPSWRFIYVGPQAVKVLGYPQKDWYEEDFWLRHMHPDDRNWVPEFCIESTEKMLHHEFDYRMYSKDGRLVWIRDSVNVIIADGEPILLRGFMFDVTAQKCKEEAFELSQQRLLEAQRIARLGHWDWDMSSGGIDGGEMYWSDEHYRICGDVSAVTKASYKKFLDYIHPDDRDKWKQAVRDALSKGSYSLDFRIVLKNSDARYIHWQCQVQYDDASRPVRMFGTIQDVSERKYLENALKGISRFFPSDGISEYYRTCVESFAHVYNTPYAFIGLYSDDSKSRITTQAVWANGCFVDNFEYELAGTPCSDVIDMKIELIAEHAARLYPLDTMLTDMGVESYFGAPMISVSGKKLGIIAVMDKKPMKVTPWTEPILGVFAQRIASYLENIHASEKLEASEKELRNIFHNMQDTFYRTDNEGTITRLSESVEQLLGYEIDELIGTSASDLHIVPDRQRDLIEQLNEGNGSVQGFDAGLKRKDGSVVWVSTNAQYYRDASGKPQGIEGLVRNISQHHEAELKMQKMSSALEQTADMVMITDHRGMVEYVNPAFEKTTGYLRKSILGKPSRVLKSGKQSADFYNNLWRTILSGNVFRDVLVNRKKNGDLYYEEKIITPIKNSKGEIINFVATGRDITERMQHEERLSFMAHHDALTELPNRTLFMDRLKQSLAHARRYEKKIAVLFIDLDRFKNINDTLGHDTGDQMLTEVAARLGKNIRQEDTVARLGGDEFSVLLTNIEAEQDASLMAEKILLSLSVPLQLDQQELFITASIGISMFPSDGVDAGTLLKNADIAMYKAKDLGKDNYQFYSTDMSARAFQRLTMENSLRRALEREEFVLFYQPQVNIKTDRISGAEALVRWKHPELGLVSPSDFVPLLEETGLIAPVGYWIFESACKQLKIWHDMGFSGLEMSINISGRQFHSKNFVEKIENIIKENNCSSEMIEIEITESVLMENQHNSMPALEALDDIGFKIAIDDFGTGYSSLSYLRHFRIDTLKVDQSFVRDVNEDPDDAAITSAIIAMAHSLNLRVIAEGVETYQQLEFLKQRQCEYVQGYLFSRPLPVDEFTKLLKKYFFSNLGAGL